MSGRASGPADYSAALYLRLSRDDEGRGESASITAQRKLLLAYAKERRYRVLAEYVDDGISGTTFERPAFQRMLRDIEAGRVNMVLTKDLSRLGRDYIQAGQYTEIWFPSHGVRYIAVNDGYDSQQDSADIAPFKNVMKNTHHSGKRISTKSPATDKSHSNRILPHSPKGMCCTTITA